MKSAAQHTLASILLALALPFPASADNGDAPEAAGKAAAESTEASDDIAAELDATEVAPDSDYAAENAKSYERLKLLDQSGTATMSSVVDALPKGFILGAGAVYVPDRFSDQETNFYAFPGFMYLGDRFFYLGDRASYALVRGKHLTFNVNARYRFGVLDPDDEPEFSTLESRDGQIEAGFGLNALTPIGFFTSRINADVSGKSEGYLANATWFLPYYKRNVLIMPAIGYTWFDSDFSNYYLGGVSAEEANPLVPAFDTGSSSSLNSMLVLGYRFNRHWFVTGGVVHFRFSDNLADSPLLLDRSRTNYFSAIGYIWD